MNILGSETLEDRLVETRWRPSGFDYLRIVLAMLVFLCLTVNVVFGEHVVMAVWRGPLRPFMAVAPPMFFALSGFLVAGSLERCRSLTSFLGLRIIRIVPALAVQVILSAILLGPIFTTLELGRYFTDGRFYAFFLNIVGDVHMELPGVFTHNVWKNTVNLQLGVLPRELKCYILLALMSLIGFLKPTRQTLIFIVLMHIGAALYFSLAGGQFDDNPNILRGWLLVLCFMGGVTAYIFRKQIPYNLSLFAICFALSLMLLGVPGGDYFTSMPVTYATICLGLQNPGRSRLILSGDYSYGIYLYGFPIQQAVAALGSRTSPWYFSVALALLCTTLLAVASWWLVEKPVQRLRPALARIEYRELAALEQMRSRCREWVRKSLSNE